VIKSWPVLHRAQVTIETLSPLAIMTGFGEGAFDTQILRDWNELPYIPATSIIGVIRSLARKKASDVDTLFGFQNADDGQISKVSATNAVVHDSSNKPVSGYDVQQEDPVLNLLAQSQPVIRDYVKINDNGVASDTGKFDKAMLPKGTRFSFYFSYWNESKDTQEFEGLLSLFFRPEFRLGSGALAGNGQVKVVSCDYDIWDLTTNPQQYINHRLGQSELSQPYLDTSKDDFSSPIKLKLTMDNYWRFGQGEQSFVTDVEKTADALMYSESIIAWQEHKASVIVNQHVVLPGTAIKGALRHRIKYHYLCEQQVFADDIDGLEDAELELARYLFGGSPEEHTKLDEHYASLLVVDDTYFDVNALDFQQVTHNSIDRFTGGTRKGALYQEELAWKTAFDVNLQVRHRVNEQGNIVAMPAKIKSALHRALIDLVEGQLALGASSSKGYGYCKGTIESDWLGV
jgi:CRISPR/Cas system CSM-associated protein Csm3 (group 7 of RAMP superfamily)